MTQLLRLSLAAMFAVHLAQPAFAQTPPAPPAGVPADKQKPATTQPSTRPANPLVTISVQVTDKSGNGIPDVAVAVSGPVERSGVTARDGTVAFRSMRSGQYRLRFEHDSYITLEREQLVRPQASEVLVSLNPAPPAKVVLPAAPEPSKPVDRPAPSGRVVEPRYLDILDFLERNLITSGPQKTTTIACTDGGTARILQVRDPLTNDVHSDFDELLYVVAGSGIVRVKDRDILMNPGAFMLIPRGATHSLRRDKRNPLITLSVFMGAPCQETSAEIR